MQGLIEKSFLTPKESEVVRLVAKGMSRKETAYELGMASSTLNTHFKHIFKVKHKEHDRNRHLGLAEPVIFKVKPGRLFSRQP